MRKFAFIFPGQGAQYVGMGKDFCDAYPIARETFEEAEDLLQQSFQKIIFNGPETTLTETHNSQLAIYVVSVAILRVVQKLYPEIKPSICSGLSLGEYTALTAAEIVSFADALPVVQKRGQLMSKACEQTNGTMAVVLGLDSNDVEAMVHSLNLPNDIWTANFNSPGQVVLSGTAKGIAAATDASKKAGAKRVLPLQVHGAFHSGLMQSAQDQLAPYIQNLQLKDSETRMVMNVPGDFVVDKEQMKEYLTKQVTQSVRWEQGVKAIQKEGVTHFLEIGCGKTLAGLNKRIGVAAPTISIDKVEDLKQFETTEVMA